MKLADKCALVTGGASGIGLAIARRFAQDGATVAVVDIDRDATELAVDRIRRDGGKAGGYVADAADVAQASAAVALVVDDHGGVDVLVNAAGLTSSASDADPLQLWRKGLDQTLFSAYLMSSLAVPLMQRHGGGSVVHISSIAALGGSGAQWYAAAKTGLLSLTRTQATQLGRDGIRVNAICPGVIDTPRTRRLQQDPAALAAWNTRTPLGRIGRPEEIAEAALFLASDETASFITGVVLTVDGGRIAAG